MTKQPMWHVHLFRVFVLLTCIAGVRLTFGLMHLNVLGKTADNEALMSFAARYGLYLPWRTPRGDDLRRGDLHPDLVVEGQVVRRNGKLVVMEDVDDPQAETFHTLDPAEDVRMSEPLLLGGSALAGTALFFVVMGGLTLVSRRNSPPGSPQASADEPDPLVQDDGFPL